MARRIVAICILSVGGLVLIIATEGVSFESVLGAAFFAALLGWLTWMWTTPSKFPLIRPYNLALRGRIWKVHGEPYMSAKGDLVTIYVVDPARDDGKIAGWRLIARRTELGPETPTDGATLNLDIDGTINVCA